MKTKIMQRSLMGGLAACAVTLALETINSVSAGAIEGDPPYLAVQAGPHHTVFARDIEATSPDGQVFRKRSRYTELATGLNRLGPDGLYHRADPRLQITARGAEALNAACQVRLPNDIAEDFSIEVTKTDGVLKSHPVGLCYYDPVDGRRVTLGTVRSAQGWLVGPTTVVYSNCLSDLVADMRYTVSLAGLEQDLILHEAPLPATKYGLSAESRLEFVTEFDPATPEPRRWERLMRREADPARRQAMVDPDFKDQTLAFGDVRMVPGRAFTTSANSALRRLEPGVRVGKSFQMRLYAF